MNTYRVTRKDLSCSCYVLRLPQDVQMSLHYGAHERHCHVYRPSTDPVDAMHDQDIRRRYTQPTPNITHNVIQ